MEVYAILPNINMVQYKKNSTKEILIHCFSQIKF